MNRWGLLPSAKLPSAKCQVAKCPSSYFLAVVGRVTGKGAAMPSRFGIWRALGYHLAITRNFTCSAVALWSGNEGTGPGHWTWNCTPWADVPAECTLSHGDGAIVEVGKYLKMGLQG